jgi:polysaccharide biosynthesis/export protein VpsN
MMGGRVLLALAVASAACATKPRPSLAVPPPVGNDGVGPDDLISVTIGGEESLPRDFRVAADGAVSLPYLGSVRVGGLEASAIAALVRAKLIENDVLRDPTVNVLLKENNSRWVVVAGQVRKEGTIPLMPGLTLIQALAMAGGFNTVADREHLSLDRQIDGQRRVFILSADAILTGAQPDVPLQSRDRIWVSERIF